MTTALFLPMLFIQSVLLLFELLKGLKSFKILIIFIELTVKQLRVFSQLCKFTHFITALKLKLKLDIQSDKIVRQEKVSDFKKWLSK